MKVNFFCVKLISIVLMMAMLFTGIMPVMAQEIEWFDFNNTTELPEEFRKDIPWGGTLTVANDAMSFSGMHNGDDVKKIEWFRDVSYKDFVFECKFKPTSESAQVLRWRIRTQWWDAWQKHYSFEYSMWSGKFEVKKSYVNPDDEYAQKTFALYKPGTTEEASINYTDVGGFALNEWHTIQLAVSGDAESGVYVTAYLDGKLLLQGYDHKDCNYPAGGDPYEQSGGYGFSNTGVNGEMDDIYAAELDQMSVKKGMNQVRDFSQLTAGDTVTANAYVYNNTGVPMTRNLLAAWYGADGSLVDVSIGKVTLEKNGLVPVSAELTLPNKEDNISDCVLRTFLWGDLTTDILPVLGIKEIKEIQE